MFHLEPTPSSLKVIKKKKSRFVSVTFKVERVESPPYNQFIQAITGYITGYFEFKRIIKGRFQIEKESYN
jgi:hypothetical protein